MKKYPILLLLLSLTLWGQSYLISSIPLPKTYVQNLEPYECDTECLKILVEQEHIFSFLAYAGEHLDDPELEELRLIHVGLFNLGAFLQDNRLRIALLLPYRVIGRYANSTTNAVFAYMLTKNRDYEIRSYQIDDESAESIEAVLKRIAEDGFAYVIAPVTKEGARVIADSHPDLNVYFPTINRADLNVSDPSLYFGGIDYRAQIDLLMHEAASPLVVFYDNSRLGNELHDYTRERYAMEPPKSLGDDASPAASAPNRYYSFPIDKRTSNLEHQLKENGKIANGSFMLNTPIVNSGMIMSQLTLYDANATNILSTQINYDPLLFSITQYQDRKNMLIANSIGESNNVLVEANTLFGNDIVYDWINYTTTVGADLFFHLITHSNREYELPLQENQVQYPVSLVAPSYYRFTLQTPALEDATAVPAEEEAPSEPDANG